MDLCWRKVLEPGSGRVEEKEGEVPNDEVVIVPPPPPELACEPIISKPELRFRIPRVLGDISWGSEPRRKGYPLDGLAEDLGSWWLGGRTLVLPAVIASAPPGAVAECFALSGASAKAVMDYLGLVVI
jgi:hypothetical protein